MKPSNEITFEFSLHARLNEFERAKLKLEVYEAIRLHNLGEFQSSAPETYHLPSGYLASQMFSEDDVPERGSVIFGNDGADSYRFEKKVTHV